MKYWILALLLAFTIGTGTRTASAESIISSTLGDREQVGSFTSMRWIVHIQAINFNSCYVDLIISDAQGNVVLTEGMKFPMWDITGVERQSKWISAVHKKAARWAIMRTKLDCY